MQASRKHYSAYATLLDAFQSYLDAEKTYNKYFTSDNPSMTVDEWCDKMYIDLINRINRVPFSSEAADKGTAFNELVDALIKVPLEERLRDDNMESEHITFRVVTLNIKPRGGEYYGLLQADISEFEEAKKQLDELCENWKGVYSSDLKIAVGAATLKDVESKEITDICKFADQRMYQAKSEWYKNSGVNRRVN